MMRRTTADYFADIVEAEEFVVRLAQRWRRIGEGVTSLISAVVGELDTNGVVNAFILKLLIAFYLMLNYEVLLKFLI